MDCLVENRFRHPTKFYSYKLAGCCASAEPSIYCTQIFPLVSLCNQFGDSNLLTDALPLYLFNPSESDVSPNF